MKKYIVFKYDSCYPAGGLGDISGDFDTFEEAKASIEEDIYEYNEIVDRDTWEIIYSD